MPPKPIVSERSFADQTAAALDRLSDQVEDYWDDLCDWLEDENKPVAFRWISHNVLRRLTVEAPVVISFCFICVMIHLLQQTIWSGLNTFLAVKDTFDITDVMQLPRLFSHVIAHDGSLGHIKGNMVHLLLVGPSAETVFGSTTIMIVILLVAVTSAVAHIIVGGLNSNQLGASGVVFAVILLNSLVAAVAGKIPLGFILTAALWVTDELYKFFFGTDGVSHHAHLTGAIVGTAAAYYIQGGKPNLESKIEQRKIQSPTKHRIAPSPLQGWLREKAKIIKDKTR
jgi:membrane associated rhomboid family serine protease